MGTGGDGGAISTTTPLIKKWQGRPGGDYMLFEVEIEKRNTLERSSSRRMSRVLFQPQKVRVLFSNRISISFGLCRER
jgi:hypothetical protein